MRSGKEITNQTPNLANCLRSELFVIAAETTSSRTKLFQIKFRKKDKSLFVNFPYFKYQKGILSNVSWSPANKPPSNLSLETDGKIASHLVKYSHHPDGRAHFSQTGKIYTAIKKQSVPIEDIQGHVFTVQLQGLKSYEQLGAEQAVDQPTAKRITLKFQLGDTEPEALKFVAHWYSQAELQKRLNGGSIGPLMTLINPHGQSYRAFILSSPTGFVGEDRLLALSCESVPRLDNDEESVLTFIGGFDQPEIVTDLDKTTTFLALAYPATDAEELVSRLGSIDYLRPTI